MLKVLIVDDHESVCDSLTIVLERTGDFIVADKLKSADDAENYCKKSKPDLIFMDVCTENGASGLDAVKHIRGNYPDIKIIVMTGFDEISYAPRAKEAGANAFVFKGKNLEYFTDVAKGVMTGKTYFPEPRNIPMPKGEAQLSDREMEVLRLLCKHLTSIEIADELGISKNTVMFHRKNILAKTGFTTTVELAFYLVTKGWINPHY